MSFVLHCYNGRPRAPHGLHGTSRGMAPGTSRHCLYTHSGHWQPKIPGNHSGNSSDSRSIRLPGTARSDHKFTAKNRKGNDGRPNLSDVYMARGPKNMLNFAAMNTKTMIMAALMAAPAPALAGGIGGETTDDVLQLTPWAAVIALKASGIDSRHEWPRLAATAAASMAVSAGVAYTLKHTVSEQRPDGSDDHSFPSGHATIAFAGATVLHKEFGKVSPWISVAGYSVATLTAADRVMRDRHHWYDVAAGAAIGILSTELCYFVGGKLLKDKGVAVAFNGRGFDVAINIR